MKDTFLTTLLLVVLSSELSGSDRIDLDHSPSETEIFAEGIISTDLYERDIAISPKGDEIIFTLCDYKRSKMCLVRIVKIGDVWSNREILDFSGQYDDIEPCFSADGIKLYFASNRPMDSDTARTDFNIWVSKRSDFSWSEPEPLPSAVNTEHDEFYPSVSRYGNLYFTSSRENGVGSEDIFVSNYVDGIYSDPEPLDTSINTPIYEFNAFISPDEDLIIFSSFGRDDGFGGGDLYYSTKDETGNWIPSQNMGDLVNSEYLDYCPFVDVHRKNFYFTSERFLPINEKLENVNQLEAFSNGILNGMGNIYRVRFNETQIR
ncbi:PD40 domain-containing protein [candidate division WOR-3 bacterium]|nr:PD40 domain-containing protein [candidate division WOR-3 bacterium]